MVSLSDRLKPKENTISSYLVFSQSLSSIAPLGSAAAYLTYALTFSLASTFYAGIFGVLIYGLWVIIGYRYSKYIATTGGTYDFARIAAGNLVGKIAGWLYWISYAIYLPSATTYISAIILPSIFNIGNGIYIVEILIPIVMTILLISGIKPPLFYALFTSLIEISLIVILAFKVISIEGIRYMPLDIFSSNFWSGALAVSFTLAGGGASFFLGYEAKGKGKTVSNAYVLAYIIASLAVLTAALFEIAAVGYNSQRMAQLLGVTQYPLFYISREFMGKKFSILVGIFTLNSLFGSALAAYVALSRLTYTIYKQDMMRSIAIVAAFFIILNTLGVIFSLSVSNALNLLYFYTTEVSEITLFSSHAIISAVYPLFTKKLGFFNIMDIILAAAASGLMIYGIISYFY